MSHSDESPPAGCFASALQLLCKICCCDCGEKHRRGSGVSASHVRTFLFYPVSRSSSAGIEIEAFPALAAAGQEPVAIPMTARDASENMYGGSRLNDEDVWWGVAGDELGSADEELAGWPMMFPIDDIR